jgi:sulfur-carrier protein
VAKVQIQYFAILREQRGVPEETIATTATSAAELYNELRTRYRFTLPLERVRVAVNDEFVAVTTLLRNGDCIVFIPPVAGG